MNGRYAHELLGAEIRLQRHVLQFQANATGRNAKTVREFLEKNYNAEEMESEEKVIKLAIRALLEVVQSGSKNLELAIMRRGHPLKMLEVDEIEKHVAAVEKEKEEEAERKKQKK